MKIKSSMIKSSMIKSSMKKALFVVLMVVSLFALSGTAMAGQRVKLNRKKVTLKPGQRCQLVLKNAKAKKVKWSSSNKKVAAVNKKGRVTAKKKGTSVITAKYKGRKYTATIKVKGKGKAKAKTKNAVVCTRDEYYKPDKPVIQADEFDIDPYHIYYKGDELWVECYLCNGNDGPVVNIDIISLELYDYDVNVFASKSFGKLNIKIPARSYVKHTFVFEKGDFTKTDLRRWFYASGPKRYDVLDPEGVENCWTISGEAAAPCRF